MRGVAWLIVAGSVMASLAQAGGPKGPVEESCGWLVTAGDELHELPASDLKPSDSRPLPDPPDAAKAAYCDRDRLMTYVGDERLLIVRRPLVIRARGAEGVLEYDPYVTFNYHRDGSRYLPGKPTGPMETIRAKK